MNARATSGVTNGAPSKSESWWHFMGATAAMVTVELVAVAVVGRALRAPPASRVVFPPSSTRSSAMRVAGASATEAEETMA